MCPGVLGIDLRNKSTTTLLIWTRSHEIHEPHWKIEKYICKKKQLKSLSPLELSQIWCGHFCQRDWDNKNIVPAFPLIYGQTCSAFHLFPCISHKKGSETKDIDMSVSHFPILPFRMYFPPQLGKSHHSERSPGLGGDAQFFHHLLVERLVAPKNL